MPVRTLLTVGFLSHLLAGVDTTADTLLFLIWALSLPQNLHLQECLRSELLSLAADSSAGIPTANSVAQLPYLNAVVKETLRLYAPLPGTEPRSSFNPTAVDGYPTPAGTVVGMSPYCLHRLPSIFPDPLTFNPERWLASSHEDQKTLEEMNRYFWAFSSGGRMCIGIHLAMAEMTTLTAAIYRTYRTRVRKGEENMTPGVTSRFEMFFDETAERMREHECWIDFERLTSM